MRSRLRWRSSVPSWRHCSTDVRPRREPRRAHHNRPAPEAPSRRGRASVHDRSRTGDHHRPGPQPWRRVQRTRVFRWVCRGAVLSDVPCDDAGGRRRRRRRAGRFRRRTRAHGHRSADVAEGRRGHERLARPLPSGYTYPGQFKYKVMVGDKEFDIEPRVAENLSRDTRKVRVYFAAYSGTLLSLEPLAATSDAAS